MPDPESPVPALGPALRMALDRVLRVCWGGVRGLLLSMAAVVVFIEEWGWQPLQVALARLTRWPPLKTLEARVQRASPKVALALFSLPAVLLFPVKMLALCLIHDEHTALGVTIIVLAKLFGTALLGRLFVLTESQLMQFAWFARALNWWRLTKAQVAQWLRASVYQKAIWRLLRAVRLVWFRRMRRAMRSH